MDSTEERHRLFELNEQRLKELAYRAISYHGRKPHEFVIVCIDVDDPSWTELVDYLMLDADWQQFRDRGEKPVARGSALGPVREYLANSVPGIAAGMFGELPGRIVRAVVMAAGGASLYFIDPSPEKH